MTTFAYLPVASALHDPAALQRVLAGMAAVLDAAGGVPVERAGDREDLPLAVLVLTGGTEQLIVDAAARRAPDPAVLVTHPRDNSLPAALEALARLHQDGRAGRIVAAEGAGEAMEDVVVARSLRSARIGVVGHPSDWLIASTPDAATVRASWGPTLVPLAMDDVLAAYRAAPPAASTATSFGRHAVALVEPDTVDLDRAALVLPVLRSLVDEHDLDALTVRCFDVVTALGTSGCLALADLNDAGIVAGCEGDVPSTIAMLWTRLLLGSVTWMANPAEIDERAGRILLAHCTIARSLTPAYRLRSHFESGLGVAIEGDLETGPVTLVRIGGRALDRVWVVEGEAVPHEHLEGLCRTQMAVQVDPAVAAGLLSAPLGNHIVVVRGHHRERLVDWWESVLR